MLIICVDRDNDLYEKVKTRGPVIGREANLNAAMRLALHDPQDPDANTIFAALKKFDELEKEYTTQVVTFTGDAKLGMKADKEISNQLDRVLQEFPADGCVYLSDGASDDEILPVITSRIKVISVQIVFMKQAKELEKTYFIILEKLKDPYYARIIFGVPAILLLIFSLSALYNLSLSAFGIIIGIYLLTKGFGIEEKIIEFFQNMKISFDSISSTLYILSMLLILIGFWSAYQEYIRLAGSSLIKEGAYALRGFLTLLPFATIVYATGKLIDLASENRRLLIFSSLVYLLSILLIWLIMSMTVNWIISDEPAFTELITNTIIIVVSGYVVTYLLFAMKNDFIAKANIENKEAQSQIGAYLGKIIGKDLKKELIYIQTPFGSKVQVPFNKIMSIEERVIVET